VIKQLFGIEMPIHTVVEYLRRWSFTPQKPLKRAYEQNPKAVSKWLEEEYPRIKKIAKQEGAEIHWGDETGIANNCQHGRSGSYAPRGQTPAIRLPAKKERINRISSVTNQGTVRFMIYDGTMNSQMMIKFMKRLIKDANRKETMRASNGRYWPLMRPATFSICRRLSCYRAVNGKGPIQGSRRIAPPFIEPIDLATG
jgi:hypothetical protein